MSIFIDRITNLLCFVWDYADFGNENPCPTVLGLGDTREADMAVTSAFAVPLSLGKQE